MHPSEADLDTTAETSNDDPILERAIACRALSSIGVRREALEQLRRVDIISGGLSAEDWAVIALRLARGGAVGTWAWVALVTG
jgi:hypothetical protein